MECPICCHASVKDPRALLPCGHVICGACVSHTGPRCSQCRVDIVGTLRLFCQVSRTVDADEERRLLLLDKVVDMCAAGRFDWESIDLLPTLGAALRRTTDMSAYDQMMCGMSASDPDTFAEMFCDTLQQYEDDLMDVDIMHQVARVALSVATSRTQWLPRVFEGHAAYVLRCLASHLGKEKTDATTGTPQGVLFDKLLSVLGTCDMRTVFMAAKNLPNAKRLVFRSCSDEALADVLSAAVRAGDWDTVSCVGRLGLENDVDLSCLRPLPHISPV